jgi:hypothetical protein
MLLGGCKPTLDEPKYNAGEADFERFVAVGSSFTAGYNDGALTRTGQIASIPNILAQQFALVGGGDFKQPLLPAGNGLVVNSLGQITGQLTLSSRINCAGKADFGIANVSGNAAGMQWIGNDGPYNNLGVPGAKSFQLYSQFLGKGGSAGNYYYHRFASDTGSVSGLSSTVIGDAQLINPTFFSIWMGNSDVYSYATSGGSGVVGGMTAYDITPIDTFNKAVDFIVNGLTSNGAKGVIANIPDISDIPYFNTIPYNGLTLTAAQASALNNMWFPTLGLNFVEGENPFIIRDSGGAIRKIKEGELLLLSIPSDSLLCGGWGLPQHPIAANYVIDSAELSSIKSNIALFNSKISSVAAAKGLALVDVNHFYKTLQTGVKFNGVTMSASFISGAAFSLDGIHPSNKGFALIANEFITVINARFKSNLPPVDANSYTGILFP